MALVSTTVDPPPTVNRNGFYNRPRPSSPFGGSLIRSRSFERVYFLMLIKPPGEVAVPPAKDSSKPRRRRKKREKDVFDVMEGIFGAVILGALE